MAKQTYGVYAVDKDIDLDNLHPEFIPILQSLAETLKVNVPITSGYRSQKKQDELYANRANNPYPVGKTSRHTQGIAVDVAYKELLKSPLIMGDEAKLDEVLMSLGIHRPVKGDPIHFELMQGGKTAWQGVFTDRNRDTPVYQPTLLDEERTQKEGMWNNQWYQSKEKWQDAINDSVIGGFFRDTLLDDMNRPDAGWTLTEEHIKKASSLGDRTAAMWVLENSDSEQEFMARFFTKKEDLERRRDVESMGWGLSSPATFIGNLMGDPSTYVTLGAAGVSRHLFTGALKQLGPSGMYLSTKLLSKVADKAAMGLVAGAAATAERRVAERFNGFSQDYTATFIMNSIFGAAIPSVLDAMTKRGRVSADPHLKLAAEAVDGIKYKAAYDAVGGDSAKGIKLEALRTSVMKRSDTEAMKTVGSMITDQKIQGFVTNGNVAVVKKADIAEIATESKVKLRDDAKAFTFKTGNDDFVIGLIPENWKATDSADGIIMHELAAHRGFREIMGDEKHNMLLNWVQQQTDKTHRSRLWTEAVKLNHGDSVEDVLGSAIEVYSRNPDIMSRADKRRWKTFSKSIGLEEDDFGDFLKNSVHRTIDNERGYHFDVDGNEIDVNGVFYSEASVMKPSVVQALLDDDLSLGGKVMAKFESWGLTGSLSGITRNAADAQVRELSDAIMDYRGGNSMGMTAEKIKYLINGRFSKARAKIVNARSTYAKSTLKFSNSASEEFDDLALLCHKEKYGLKADVAGKYHPSVIEAADGMKDFRDIMLAVGKKSAEDFGFDSSRNMIQKDFEGTDFWFRVTDEVKLRRFIDEEFNNDVGAARKWLTDYFYTNADRAAEKKKFLVQNAELTDISDDYLENLIRNKAEGAADNTVRGFDSDVTLEGLRSTAADVAEITGIGDVRQLKARIELTDPGAEMVLPSGRMGSWDSLLQSNDIERTMSAISDRFSGEAALKARLGDVDIDDTLKGIAARYEAMVRSGQISQARAQKEQEALMTSLNILRGFKINVDPDTAAKGILSLFRKLAYAKSGGNMGINQIAEGGGAAGILGLDAALDFVPGLGKFLLRARYGKIAAEESLAISRYITGEQIVNRIGGRRTSSRRFKEMLPQNQRIGAVLDTLDSAAQIGSNITSKVNRVDNLTFRVEHSSTARAAAQIIEIAHGKKRLMQSPLSKAKLKTAGMTQGRADEMLAAVRKYIPETADQGKIMDDFGRWAHESPQTYQDFTGLIMNQSRRAITQRTLGSTPYITSKSEAMRVLFQFKDFTMRAANSQVLRALTEREFEDVVAAAYSSATNSLAYVGITYAKANMLYGNDESKRKKYLEKMLSPKRIALAALLRGMYTGALLSTPNDIYEAFTGGQSFRTTVDRSYDFFKSTENRDAEDIVGSVIGQSPAISSMFDVYKTGQAAVKAVLPGQQVTQRDARHVLNMLPLMGSFIPLMSWREAMINRFPKKSKKQLELWK